MEKLELQLRRFLDKGSSLDPTAFVAQGAVVTGDVTLGAHSSVWHNAVLRGDINFIRIGHHTNVQDNAVVHLADDFPCVVGNYVTIGHSAIVHACTVEDECLIGMGAIILDGAIIGRQSLVGAGALVTQHMRIPEGSLVIGSPGKVVRALSEEERSSLRGWAEKYVVVAAANRVRQPVSPRT